MTRWMLAGALALMVAGLFAWQLARERQMSACTAKGGVWNGPISACDAAPPPIILQRDLQRS